MTHLSSVVTKIAQSISFYFNLILKPPPLDSCTIKLSVTLRRVLETGILSKASDTRDLGRLLLHTKAILPSIFNYIILDIWGTSDDIVLQVFRGLPGLPPVSLDTDERFLSR